MPASTSSQSPHSAAFDEATCKSAETKSASRLILKKDLVIPAGTEFLLVSEAKVHGPAFVSNIGVGENATVSVYAHPDDDAGFREHFDSSAD